MVPGLGSLWHLATSPRAGVGGGGGGGSVRAPWADSSRLPAARADAHDAEPADPPFDFASLPADVQELICRSVSDTRDLAALEAAGALCRAAVGRSGAWQALAAQALGPAAAAELRPRLGCQAAKVRQLGLLRSIAGCRFRAY